MTAPDGYPFDPLDDPSGVDGLSAVAVFPSATVFSPVHALRCSPAFRDAVLALAARRGCDATALASAALLLAGGGDAGLDEDGDEGDGDETAVLELRLGPAVDGAAVRRALATALALADPAGWRLVRTAEMARLKTTAETLEYRNKALVNALERVAFLPLSGGLKQVRDAAQLFGFVNEWCFDEDRVVRRFRELAPVYHPDTGVVGCRERMAQLIEARNLLVHHVRTAYISGEWGRRGV